MKPSDIPNIITLLRIALVPAVVVALLEQHFTQALFLFAVAGISDGLDGYLAKRYHWSSRLGSILDPLADKLLLVGTFVSLFWLELLPWWLMAAIVGRDVLIVCGALAYHLMIGAYELTPTFLSKANTFFQIILGLAIVLAADLLMLPDMVLVVLVYVVLVVTVLSGMDYVWTWSRRARQHWQQQVLSDD